MNPPGLNGNETLHGSVYEHSYQWTLPNTIAEGNTATLTLTANSKHDGSETAYEAFKPPSEMGSSEGLFQLQATAPPNSSKTETKTTTFHPTRAFTAGEKLYIRIETGCAAWIYEYVGR
jgi:hypothetical protein